MADLVDPLQPVRAKLAQADRKILSTEVLAKLDFDVKRSGVRQQRDLSNRAEHLEQIGQGIHAALGIESPSISSLLGYTEKQAFEFKRTVAKATLKHCEKTRAQADSLLAAPHPEPQGAELWGAVTRLDEVAALDMVARSDFAEPYFDDAKGRTALHCAAWYGLCDVCASLLCKPAFTKVSARDHSGFTALHYAAQNGHSWICLAILDCPRFDAVHVQSDDGSSALHCAAQAGHEEACESLLGHPRFTPEIINVVDESGWTALHHAASSGHANVCRALLMHNKFAGAATRNRDGRTALHLASLGGHADACRELVTRVEVVDLDARDNGGETALELADVGSDAWHIIFKAANLLLQMRFRKVMRAVPAPSAKGVGPWPSREAWRI